MSEIKDVRYFHENKPYRFNGNKYPFKEVTNAVKAIQLRDYAKLADEINSEGGWLEVHLSDPEDPRDDVSYETRVLGVSDHLQEKIHQSLHGGD